MKQQKRGHDAWGQEHTTSKCKADHLRAKRSPSCRVKSEHAIAGNRDQKNCFNIATFSCIISFVRLTLLSLVVVTAKGTRRCSKPIKRGKNTRLNEIRPTLRQE